MPLALGDLSPAKHTDAENSSDDSDYDPHDPLASLEGDSVAGGDSPDGAVASEEDIEETEDLDGDGEASGDASDASDATDEDANDGDDEAVMAAVTAIKNRSPAALDGKAVSLCLHGDADKASIITIDSSERLPALSECLSHDNTAAAIDRDGNYVARVVLQSPLTEGEPPKAIAIDGAGEISMVADVFKSSAEVHEWSTLVRECDGVSTRGLSKVDREIRESYGIEIAVKGGKAKKRVLYSLRALEYAKKADKYKSHFEKHRVKQMRAAKRRAKGAPESESATPKQTSIVSHVKAQATASVSDDKASAGPAAAAKPKPTPTPKPAAAPKAKPKAPPKPKVPPSPPPSPPKKRQIDAVDNGGEVVAPARPIKRVCTDKVVIVVVDGKNLNEVLEFFGK